MSLTLTRRTLCITLAPIVLFLSMSCGSGADDHVRKSERNQEITVEEVIQRLEQVEAKLHSFRVHCLSNTKLQLISSGVIGQEAGRVWASVPSIRTTTDSVWHYRNNGSSRIESERVQINVSADGSRQVKRYSAYSVFDGPRGRGKYLWLNSPDSDGRVAGNNEEKYVSTPQGHLQNCPIEFLTQSSGRSFSEELRQGEAKIARRERHGGRTLVVLNTSARQTRPNIEFYQYREFSIDIERGVVVRRETFDRDSEESSWGIGHRQESSDYEWDAGSQLWLPTSAMEFRWSLTKQRQRKLVSVEAFAYSNWEINPQFDDETFSIDQDWSSLKDRR